MQRAIGLIGDFVDGQRHAIDGNRALCGNISRERRGRGNGNFPAIANLFACDNLSNAIDMASDDMAAKFITDL